MWTGKKQPHSQMKNNGWKFLQNELRVMGHADPVVEDSWGQVSTWSCSDFSNWKMPGTPSQWQPELLVQHQEGNSSKVQLTYTLWTASNASLLGHVTIIVGKVCNLAKLIRFAMVSKQLTTTSLTGHFAFILATENENWDTPLFNCKVRPHLNLTPANHKHLKPCLLLPSTNYSSQKILTVHPENNANISFIFSSIRCQPTLQPTLTVLSLHQSSWQSYSRNSDSVILLQISPA